MNRREAIPFGPLASHQFFRLNHAKWITGSGLRVKFAALLREFTGPWFTWAGLLVMVFALRGEDGFEPIFDERSLASWETPDPSYWTVEE